MPKSLSNNKVSDTWRSEILTQLKSSLIYNRLIKLCKSPDNMIIALVDDAVDYSFQRTKTIIRHMGEYTLHDGDHLFRVLNIMERILTPNNINKLSIPELMLLLLSAFFHDIGMAPAEHEVIAWKKVWDDDANFENDEELELFEQFERFYSSNPDQQEIINKLISQGKNSQADTLKGYLISEYIRKTHSDRARTIIDKDWKGKIKYREKNLTVELANICHSHNEDAFKLLEMDINLSCGSNTYICLPLIGVILRLADILDFDAKRTPRILFSHLQVKEPVSLKEWNKHRAIESWDIEPALIQFNATCTHPAIEASIHEFCTIIDHELSVCNNIITALNNDKKFSARKIDVKFPFQVNRKNIVTEKDTFNQPIYKYQNTKFNLSKKQVIDLLMGTKLYGNPEVALRELLQNSIDACLLRQAQEKQWGNHYIPEILVNFYSHDGDEILEITDNGTGMDQHIIDNYYSKVGSSFYKSTEFYDLKAGSKAGFTPTSRFGIGILSCFMVADILIVDTRKALAKHESGPPINITIEGQESIFCIKPGKNEELGTTTKLILRDTKNPWGTMSDKNLIKSVENVILNPPFSIKIKTNSEVKIINQHTFEEASADTLRDYSWRTNENIRIFEFRINNPEVGIMGSAVVAILESHGTPVSEIEITSKTITFDDGNTYDLEKSLSLSINSIQENSKTITITDDGSIKEDYPTSRHSRSKSKISLHGIEVSTPLFPDSWDKKPNQVELAWPFPLLLIVDICGNRDLDLNSSRTEIIMNEKWYDFSEELSFLVCSKLADSISSEEYWNELKTLLSEKSDNIYFKRGLDRVVYNDLLWI